MAKSNKKKKVSLAEQQKMQQAHFKNLFKEKVMHICEVLESASLYHLIPPTAIEDIYRMRGAPLHIKAAKGAKIQKRLLEVLEMMIKHVLLTQTIELIPYSNLRISIGDYFQACSSLEYTLGTDRYKFDGKERFNRFLRYTDYRDAQYNDEISRACHLVSTMYDDLGQKRLYTFLSELKTVSDIEAKNNFMLNKYAKNRQMLINYANTVDFRIHHNVFIDTLPLEVRHITMDNENRPIIQLGRVVYSGSAPKLQGITIPIEQLNQQTQFGKLSVPVYFQQHALNRLMERTGIKVPGYALTMIKLAFAKPVILPTANNRFLIEYEIECLKVGYFLTELKDGILVVRTFLFLTNSGTPEGNKLAQMTRLQKKDREYLAIDNLRTLASSDILENEFICKLFRDAGCESILQMCERRKKDPDYMNIIGVEEQKTSLSELISEYLKPDADNEEYVVGE